MRFGAFCQIVKYSTYFEHFVFSQGEPPLLNTLISVVSNTTVGRRKNFKNIVLEEHFEYAGLATELATSIALERPIFIYNPKEIFVFESKPHLYLTRKPVGMVLVVDHFYALVPVSDEAEFFINPDYEPVLLQEPSTLCRIFPPLNMSREEQRVGCHK